MVVWRGAEQPKANFPGSFNSDCFTALFASDVYRVQFFTHECVALEVKTGSWEKLDSGEASWRIHHRLIALTYHC